MRQVEMRSVESWWVVVGVDGPVVVESRELGPDDEETAAGPFTDWVSADEFAGTIESGWSPAAWLESLLKKCPKCGEPTSKELCGLCQQELECWWRECG